MFRKSFWMPATLAAATVLAISVAGVVGLTHASTSTDTALTASEVRVNSTTTLVQQTAAVARDGVGNFFVVWTGATATDAGQIYMQRFFANGTTPTPTPPAQNTEATVTTTAGAQTQPAIAMAADGRFVVAWTSAGQDGSGLGVYARLYGADGTAVATEFKVNTTTSGDQQKPSVAMAPDGSFVVAWQCLGTAGPPATCDGSGQGVFAQRYNASGVAQGTEFQVNTTTAASQQNPSVAMDASGNFVVAWQSNGQDGDLEGIFARRFQASGTASTGEVQVNTITTGSQTSPSVGVYANGAGFVVAWQGPDSGSATDIFARRFDGNGAPVDSQEFTLNTTTTGTQAAPRVAADADGDFVVTWESDQDASSFGVIARRFTRNSSVGTGACQCIVGSEFLVNTTTALDQRRPAVAMDADGDYVVVWDGNGGAADADGVFMRRYSGPETVDLKVTETDSMDAVQTSNSYSYVLTVVNQHAAVTTTGVASVYSAIGAATSTTLTDTLPPNSTFVSASSSDANWTCPTSATGGAITCTYAGGYAATRSTTITVTVIAPATTPPGHTYQNQVVITADQFDADEASSTGTNSASEDTVVCGTTESTGTINVVSRSFTEPTTGTSNVQVTVNRAPTGNAQTGTCGAVSVSWSTADGGGTNTAAKAGLDYTTSSGTLSWPDGDITSRTVNIPVLSDALDEDDENFTVNLGNAVRATLGTAGIVTINDSNTPPTADFALASSSAGEAAGTATIKVVLSAVSGRTTSIPFTISGGTATFGASNDYTFAPSNAGNTGGTLSIPAGQTSGAIVVTINNDAIDEPDETINFSIDASTASSSYMKGATHPTHTFTILDDDPPPTANFSSATNSANEGTATPPATTARNFDLTLSQASSKIVTIPFTITGSATYSTNCTAGSDKNDYSVSTVSDTNGSVAISTGPSGTTGTVTFTPTNGLTTTSRTITMNVCNDTINENDEDAVFTIGDPPTDGTAVYQKGTTGSHQEVITDDDPAPTVTFFETTPDTPVYGGTVAENVPGGTKTIDVRLSSVSAKTVTVNYSVAAGSPAATGGGVDYAITGGASPIVFNPGDPLDKFITVSLVDDNLDEDTEKAVFTLGTLSNATPGTNKDYTLSITDNDPTPTVSFTTAAQSVPENVAGGKATATIKLSAVSGRSITVPFLTSGSANNGGANSDYTLTPASPVTIPAGTQSVDLTFNIVDDTIAEPNETATVTIQNDPQNQHMTTGTAQDSVGLGSTPAHTLTIVDNDAVPQVFFDSANVTSAIESAGTVPIKVKLSRPADNDVTLDFSVAGSATGSGVDYTLTPASRLIIAQGSSTGTINLAINNDSLDENDETVILTMTAVVNAQISPSPQQFTFTIVDDDTAGVTVTESGGSTNVIEGGATDTYTVVLNSQPIANVTVAITNTVQATANPTSLTFTSSNWNVAQTVTVTAVDDNIAEGNHSTVLNQAASSSDALYNGIPVPSVTVRITDNDTAGVAVTESGGSTAVTEGGATDSYTLALTSQPLADVTFSIAGDSQVTVNKSSVTFTNATWNVPQTVTVTAVDDKVAEGNHTGTIVHGTASSADASYSTVSARTVTVQITDNDTAGVVLSKSSVSVAEGGATDTYTVRLNSQPTANVTITLDGATQLQESSGGSTPAQMLTLTFTPISGMPGGWDVPQVVTVTATDDAVAEGPHNGLITHAASSSDSNYRIAMAGNVSASITDNDTAGVSVVQSGGSTAVTEGGSSDSYTVALTSQPTATVSITINPGSQLVASPTTLTFTSSNYATPQTVTVTAVDDSVAQGTRMVSIAQGASSTDSTYNRIAVASVPVTITDNDTASVVVAQSGGSTAVSEGGSSDTYTVALTSQPTANVTITVNAGSQLTASPTTLTFTPANYSATQTVTVSAVDDAVAQGRRTVSITQSAASTDSTYNGIAVASVLVSITDNDTAGVTVTQSGGSTAVTEGGASDTYTLVLTSQPTANVTITVNAGSQLTASPTTLTFTPANYTTPQSVAVTAVDDAVAQGTRTVSIAQSAASADSAYNGISVASVLVSITDNDTAGVTVTQSGGSTAVTEGGASDTYTLVLTSQPTANVTITLDAGSQLAVSPASVTFTPSNYATAQTITVSAVDDAVAEGTHSGVITQTAASSDASYGGIAIPNVSATITDNDTAGVTVTQSGGSTAVTEGGAGDTYTLALTSQPTANVTITVNANSQLTITPASVTFTPSNYSMPQTVTVTAVDDAVAQGSRTVSIAQSAGSGDGNYNGIAVAGVPVTIADNDTPGLNVTQSGGSTAVTEGGADDTFTVALTSQPTANVTITISPDSQLTVNPSTLTFTAANYATAQTVTVSAVNDDQVNGTRTVTVGVSAASADAAYSSSVVNFSVTISDNDSVTAGDNAPGVVVTPSGSVVVTSSSGGGAFSWQALLALFALAALRRRFGRVALMFAALASFDATAADVPINEKAEPAPAAEAAPSAPPSTLESTAPAPAAEPAAAVQPEPTPARQVPIAFAPAEVPEVVSALSYSGFALQYLSVKVKEPGASAKGFGLELTRAVSESAFIGAGYGSISTADFQVLGTTGSSKTRTLNAVLGVHRAVSPRTDVVGSLSYLSAKAEGQGGFTGSTSGSGYDALAGLRGVWSRTTEWRLAYDHVKIFGGSDNTVSGSVLFHTGPHFGLWLGAGTGSHSSQSNLGARYQF